MTLFQIVSILKQIALAQPNVQTATDGSVYDVMNTNPSVKYDVVHLTQTKHIGDEETDTYGFNIFYISRLEDSLEDNRLQIQSIGKEVLDNILRTFCENWGIDFPDIIYYPFTQKFTDLCAGVYCRVEIEVPREIICADDYTAEIVPGSGLKLQDMGITITHNGITVVTPDAEYDGIGEIRIETDVPQTTAELQYKEVEYTENGEYTIRPDQDYDGMTEVAVSVNVPSDYQDGYDDGEADQKAKLTITSFTENDTYTRADGWSAVTVNVPQDQGYDEGYADGEAAQKAKLVTTTLTSNDTFTREDGWSAVTVDVPTPTLSRFSMTTNGTLINQTAPEGTAWSSVTVLFLPNLTGGSATLTQNGTQTFTPPQYYNFSSFTVNVDVPPVTAYTDQDLIANLQGDYYVIPSGTTQLREYALYSTCFSSITIPDTVRVIRAYAFANNTCLTSMTIPSSVSAVGSYVFGGCSALEELTFEGTTPPNLGNTGNSLGSTAYTFPIYVPCQSLQAYRTAFGSAYAPRIQCKTTNLITGITINVANTITDTGTATTTYSPASAYTDIYYTSSDPTKATIDENTGAITVSASGNVTFCAIDRLSELQDCKTVAVRTSAPSLSIYVPDVVRNSATATTTVRPSTTTTNLRYSSSDTTKATINATTGEITVTSSGMVTFCVTDTISSAQSCKTVFVMTGDTAVSQLDFQYATTAANQTNILFYGTAQDNSANFDSFYNAIVTMIIDGNLVTKNSANIVTPTVERNYKRYKYTFPSAGTHNVKFIVQRSISGDGLTGLWLTTKLFADNLSEMHLVSAKVGWGYEKLGDGTFQGGSELTAVTIPSTVTTIGPFTFEHTAIKTLVIPDGVTGLTEIAPGVSTTGQGICNRCYSLTSVTIGTGLTEIIPYTFENCTALRDVTMNRTTPPTLSSSAFEGCTSLENIYVPAASVNAYKSASGWSSYASIIKAKTS